MIELDDGTAIPIADLLIFMMRNGVTEMPIAQQHVAIWDHTEQLSLDFFMRLYSDNMDTAQATYSAIEHVLGSDYFEPAQVTSPETGRMVKGIRITMA